MSFYSELVVVYEKVFPVNSSAIKFLAKNLKQDKSVVLDVACGIGGHCMELARTCQAMYGVDSEREMIAKANKENKLENINYIVGDMLNITNLFEVQFNSIYCIGNSLVHLSSREEVLQFLRNSFEKLENNGELIIQIINYDRIFSENIKSLPIIENSDVVFIRKYKYESDASSVDFVTQLNINDSTYHNTVKLLALKSNELLAFLKKAGFKKSDIYGDFNENKHSLKSYATVVRAIKNCT